MSLSNRPTWATAVPRGLLALVGSFTFYGPLYLLGVLAPGSAIEQTMLAAGLVSANAAGIVSISWFAATVPPRIAAAGCGLAGAVFTTVAAAFDMPAVRIAALSVAGLTTLIPTFALTDVARRLPGGSAVSIATAVWFGPLAGAATLFAVLDRAVGASAMLGTMAATGVAAAVGSLLLLDSERPSGGRVAWGAQWKMLREPALGRVVALMAISGATTASMQTFGVLLALQIGLTTPWLSWTLLLGVATSLLAAGPATRSPRAAFITLFAITIGDLALAFIDPFLADQSAARALLLAVYGIIQGTASATYVVGLVAAREEGQVGARHATEGALRQAAPLAGQILVLAFLPAWFLGGFAGVMVCGVACAVAGLLLLVRGRADAFERGIAPVSTTGKALEAVRQVGLLADRVKVAAAALADKSGLAVDATRTDTVGTAVQIAELADLSHQLIRAIRRARTTGVASARLQQKAAARIAVWLDHASQSGGEFLSASTFAVRQTDAGLAVRISLSPGRPLPSADARRLAEGLLAKELQALGSAEVELADPPRLRDPKPVSSMPVGPASRRVRRGCRRAGTRRET